MGAGEQFQYSYSRLTFKRDVIDRMGPGDSLDIHVRPSDGSEQVFRLTRSDIGRDFANVLASRSYREGGAYHYTTTPKHAHRYLVSGGGPHMPARRRPREPLKRRTQIPQLADDLGPIDWASAVADHAGVDRENTTLLKAVDYWRGLWRPARVRILLVAESHVAERPGDGDVRVEHPVASGPYCRLIYCLGYGEDSICSPKPEKNRGTPQFWEIFRRVSGQEGRPSREGRLPWKLRVLETLKKRGAWLVDASITALAAPEAKRRFDASLDRWIIQTSWERFVWPTVERDQPEQVWVIGRGVGKALLGHPAISKDRVISQPQDRNRARYQADLARMTDELRAL